MEVDILSQITRLVLPTIFEVAKKLGLDFLVGVERIIEFLAEIHETKPQEAAITE